MGFVKIPHAFSMLLCVPIYMPVHWNIYLVSGWLNWNILRYMSLHMCLGRCKSINTNAILSLLQALCDTLSAHTQNKSSHLTHNDLFSSMCSVPPGTYCSWLSPTSYPSQLNICKHPSRDMFLSFIETKVLGRLHHVSCCSFYLQ